MSARSQATLLAASAALAFGCWAYFPSSARTGAASPPPDAVANFAISGPYTHDNLSVFLLHGPDTLPPRPIVTLSEALEAKSFVVYETGTVNTLAVENLSDTDDVLIQPGDIVKGGRQDRLIASAVLVPAKSGKMPVPSFCVEQGRWANRGKEAATHFGENNAVIAGKALKQAALVQGEQGAVWDNVKKTQDKLAANAGKPTVQNAASPTSLQLALEDGEVRKRVDAYTAAISPKTTGRRGAVGFVVAVNGKVTGAEVYGSAAVMAKAWPKALRSAATEALAEKDAAAKFAVPTANVCRAFLADAEKGQSEMVASRNEDGVEITQTGVGEVTQTGTAAVINDFQGLVEGPGNVDLRGGARNFRYALPAPPGYRERDDPFACDRYSQPSELAKAALTGPTLLQQQNLARPGGDVIQDVVQSLEQPDGRRVQPSLVDNVDNPIRINVNRTLRTFARGDDNRIPVAPTQVNRVDGRNATLVECRDQRNPGVVIHRSFVAK